MRRTAAIFPAILLITFGATFALRSESISPRAQAADATPAPIPAADVEKKNPVKPSPAGIAAAKKTYGYDCSMCHGKDGDGKGELAVEMKLELKDWRNPDALAKMTDGELFYIITNGRGKMLSGEGERSKDEARWNLVNLVRSFAKKSPTT